MTSEARDKPRTPEPQPLGYERAAEATFRFWARGREDPHTGLETLDSAAGAKHLQEIGQLRAEKRGDHPKVRSLDALARSALGNIGSSVTPREQPADFLWAPSGEGRAQRPRPTAERPSWKPTGPLPPQKLRARLYTLRAALRPLGRETARRADNRPLSRIALCGHALTTETGAVAVVVDPDTGRASYQGVHTCGSVWECPVCQAKICAGRREELRVVLEEWHGLDRCSSWTATIRHSAGEDLRLLRGRVADAWRGMTRGKPWRKILDRLGIIGGVRSLDVTVGPHGWHPHIHAVFLHDKGLPDSELHATRGPDKAREWQGAARDLLAQRWATMVWRYLTIPHLREASLAQLEALAREADVPLEVVQTFLAFRSPYVWPREWGKKDEVEDALRAAARHVGLDPYRPEPAIGLRIFETVQAEYLAKLGLELTSAATKEARARGHYTPLQVAGIWADERAPWAAERWKEWCRGMKGARQLTWTKDLRLRAGLRERTDSDLAEDDEHNATREHVGQIDATEWRALGRACVDELDRDGKPRKVLARVWVLAQVEAHGASALAPAVEYALAPAKQRRASWTAARKRTRLNL